MAQYAVVDNATTQVVNVVEWDGISQWTPPTGQSAVLLTGSAGIGWTYANGTFTPPSGS